MRQLGQLMETHAVVATATDVGCVRQVNEDAVHVVRATAGAQPRGMLAVVCDGMGGHAGGSVASRMAIDAIVREWRAMDDGAEALQRALTIANRAIVSMSERNHELRGMGTTCVALLFRNSKVWCAHVGDSRCYMLRDGALHRMTEDHSAVMEMVRDGKITADSARTHPLRNVIRRALGARVDVDVDMWKSPQDLQAGDQFLLCSDGLHEMVDDGELCQILTDYSPRQACDLLVDLARSRGAPDNVTIALIAMPSIDDSDDQQVFNHIGDARVDHVSFLEPAQHRTSNCKTWPVLAQ